MSEPETASEAPRETPTPAPSTPSEPTSAPAESTSTTPATAPKPKREATPEAKAAALELAAALEQLARREAELDGQPSRLTRAASTLALVGAGLATLGVAYAVRSWFAWRFAEDYPPSFTIPGSLPLPTGSSPLAGATTGLAWATAGAWLAAILHVGRGGAGRFAGSVVAAGGLPVFVLASVLLSDASELAHGFSQAGEVVSAAAMGATLGLVGGILELCAALTNPRDGASSARFAAALVERPRGATLWVSLGVTALLGFGVGAVVYATPDARMAGAFQGAALATTLAVGASVTRARLWLVPVVAIPGSIAGALGRVWGATVTTSAPVHAFDDFLRELFGPKFRSYPAGFHDAPDAATMAWLFLLGVVPALVGQTLGQRIGPVARVLGAASGLASAWLLLQPELAHTRGLPSLSSLLVGALVVAWVPPVAERIAGSLVPPPVES